jgi:hypothetical protein
VTQRLTSGLPYVAKALGQALCVITRVLRGSSMRGGGLVTPDADLARMLAGLSDVVRTLHAHQRVHVHAEGLLDAQISVLI